MPINLKKPDLKRWLNLKNIINHILPIICTVVIGFYIGNVLSHDIVLEVSINGKSVGYVDSYRSFDESKHIVENEIYEDMGKYYSLGCNFTYELVWVKNPVCLSNEECMDIIRSNADEEFNLGYMLYLDDEMVAACDSFDGLNGLISDIETDICNSSEGRYEVVEILNDIRIEEQLCPVDLIKSVDDINEIINPITNDNTASDDEASKEDSNRVVIDSFTALSPELAEDDESDAAFVETLQNSDFTLDYHFVETVDVREVIYKTNKFIDNPNSFIGTNEVLREGSNGSRTVTYELHYDADGNIIKRVELSEVVDVPVVNRLIRRGTKVIPPSKPLGYFIWPCDTSEGISSGYGGRDLYGSYDFHLGIDIPGDRGDPIVAADGGEVIWAGKTASYGNSVQILHNDGTISLYAHMNKLHVSIGDMVYQGQKIGEMGATGVAYGVHLHFEIRKNGETVNPIKYLPEMGK